MIHIISKAVLSLLLCTVATVGVTRQLQMLQQNSYFASRYFGWLKENKKTISFNIILIFLSFISGIFLEEREWLFSLLFKTQPDKLYALAVVAAGAALIMFVCIMAYIMAARAFLKNKRSIKPLVCTARIKRMYAAVAIITAAVGAVFTVFDSYISLAAYCALMLLTLAPCITTLLALLIAKPFEKAISAHYIKDAKKILREHASLTTLGITGSYGKTSTKFIVKRILDEGFNVVATPGSFNTPLGVVRTVREQLRPTTQVFVCEMGAKKKGDIKEICDIAKPELAIITSVGPQHLDTFGNIETVADTKFELADSANEVFLNFDNEIIRERAEKYNHTSYGTTPDCDVYAENVSYGSFGASFDIVCDGERFSVITKLLGRHNVLNILAGAAVAKRLGIKDHAIQYAVSRLTPTEHRLELKSFINGSLLIDDAYNANPEGCLEAVNVLASFEGRKKIIVTPGLVELGDKEYEYNYNLGLAAAEKCDIIILVGEKRSIPMADAAREKNFPSDKLYVVSAFSEAMELLRTLTDQNTVTLFENDLPDNYLK